MTDLYNKELPWPERDGLSVILLKDGQSILSAASTKGKRVYGPAVVEFYRDPHDHGITMTVHEFDFEDEAHFCAKAIFKMKNANALHGAF